MVHSQNVTVKVVPWWASIKGMIVGLVFLSAVAIGAYMLIVKAVTFLWPTLIWLVPVTTYLSVGVWFLYRVTQAPDEVAKSYRVYQATVMNLGNFIIGVILIVDTRTVGL